MVTRFRNVVSELVAMVDGGGDGAGEFNLTRAELFDPVTGGWVPAPAATMQRRDAGDVDWAGTPTGGAGKK